MRWERSREEGTKREKVWSKGCQLLQKTTLLHIVTFFFPPILAHRPTTTAMRIANANRAYNTPPPCISSTSPQIDALFKGSEGKKREPDPARWNATHSKRKDHHIQERKNTQLSQQSNKLIVPMPLFSRIFSSRSSFQGNGSGSYWQDVAHTRWCMHFWLKCLFRYFLYSGPVRIQQ